MQKITINQYLDEIASLKVIINENTPRDTYEYCVQFENNLTLEEIERCFSSGRKRQALNRDLKDFLHHRWERIKGTILSYTSMPSNPVNTLCLNIAKTLSPISKREDKINSLAERVGPYFLLMPSLSSSYDIYGGNIHRLLLRQFVLSDNDDSFIPLADCLSLAACSESGKLQHLVDRDKQYLPLSESEICRVTKHSKFSSDYYQAIVELNHERIHGTSLGAKLKKLSSALKKGGVHGGQDGKELDSGGAANEGIVEFIQFWGSLNEEQRKNFYSAYEGLEEILGRLMRPNDVDFQSTIYCVELLAERIDSLVQRHTPAIFSTIADMSYQYLIDHVSEKKKFFENEILREDYPIVFVKKIGLLLKIISTLNEERQAQIFHSFNVKHALNYAIKYEAEFVCDVIKEFSKEKLNNFQQEALKNALFDACDNKLGLLPLLLENIPDLIRAELLKTTNHIGETLLIKAVKSGNIEVVKNLIKYSVAVNLQDNRGDTALGWAIYYRVVPIVYELLKNGASILISNARLETPLHLAVKAGIPDIVEELLLKYEAPINFQDLYEDTPLGWAVFKGYSQIAEILLKYNAKINIRNKGGKNALDLAVESNSVEQSVSNHIIEILIKKIASAEPNEKLAILKDTSASTYKKLLENAVMNSSGFLLPLLELLSLLDNETMKVILNLSKADNGGKEFPFLFLAIDKGQSIDVVQKLIILGINLDQPNSYGYTALMQVIYKGEIELVKELLKQRANIIPRGNDGENALDIAIQYHPELIEVLLPAINQLEKEQQKEVLKKSLFKATQLENYQLRDMLFLLEKMNPFVKEDLLNELYSNGKTLLVMAAESGRDDFVLRFIRHGAEINKQDDNGNTALNRAAEKRYFHIVQLLLSLNADIRIRNKEGDNVLDLALKSNDYRVAGMILKNSVNLEYAIQDLLKKSLNSIPAKKETEDEFFSHINLKLWLQNFSQYAAKSSNEVKENSFLKDKANIATQFFSDFQNFADNLLKKLPVRARMRKIFITEMLPKIWEFKAEFNTNDEYLSLITKLEIELIQELIRPEQKHQLGLFGNNKPAPNNISIDEQQLSVSK